MPRTADGEQNVFSRGPLSTYQCVDVAIGSSPLDVPDRGWFATLSLV